MSWWEIVLTVLPASAVGSFIGALWWGERHRKDR